MPQRTPQPHHHPRDSAKQEDIHGRLVVIEFLLPPTHFPVSFLPRILQFDVGARQLLGHWNVGLCGSLWPLGPSFPGR
jgi:hypothetical protein